MKIFTSIRKLVPVYAGLSLLLQTGFADAQVVISITPCAGIASNTGHYRDCHVKAKRFYGVSAADVKSQAITYLHQYKRNGFGCTHSDEIELLGNAPECKER